MHTLVPPAAENAGSWGLIAAHHSRNGNWLKVVGLAKLSPHLLPRVSLKSVYRSKHESQDRTPWSHLGKPLKNHPSSRAPYGIRWCPCCNWIAVQFIPPPKPSSLVSFRNCSQGHTNFCLKFYFQTTEIKAIITQLYKLALLHICFRYYFYFHWGITDTMEDPPLPLSLEKSTIFNSVFIISMNIFVFLKIFMNT